MINMPRVQKSICTSSAIFNLPSRDGRLSSKIPSVISRTLRHVMLILNFSGVIKNAVPSEPTYWTWINVWLRNTWSVQRYGISTSRAGQLQAVSSSTPGLFSASLHSEPDISLQSLNHFGTKTYPNRQLTRQSAPFRLTPLDCNQ